MALPSFDPGQHRRVSDCIGPRYGEYVERSTSNERGTRNGRVEKDRRIGQAQDGFYISVRLLSSAVDVLILTCSRYYRNVEYPATNGIRVHILDPILFRHFHYEFELASASQHESVVRRLVFRLNIESNRLISAT